MSRLDAIRTRLVQIAAARAHVCTPPLRMTLEEFKASPRDWRDSHCSYVIVGPDGAERIRGSRGCRPLVDPEWEDDVTYLVGLLEAANALVERFDVERVGPHHAVYTEAPGIVRVLRWEGREWRHCWLGDRCHWPTLDAAVAHARELAGLPKGEG